MNKIKLILVGIIIILLMPTTLAGLGDSYRTTPFIYPFHDFIRETVHQHLIQPETLDDAVAEIEKMIEDGEPRWEVAKRAATIADVQIKNMNDPFGDTQIGHLAVLASIFGELSPESSLWPEDERKFMKWRDVVKGHNEGYDYVAEWVWENRVGQCSENADLVYYLLKEAGVKEVRIHYSERAKHGLVVWGMGNRDPSKPESWTDEVIVPDSWQHYVLRGKAAFDNKYVDCDYGTDRTSNKDQSACGFVGRPCCKEIDPCRFPNLFCLNDYCRGSCGTENNFCCKDEKCNEGLECNKDGKCVKKEKDTSAGDNSGKEFTCPSPPKEAKHIVTNTADYWKMPDGKIIGQYQTWWDSATAYPPHKGDKTRRLWLGCYNTEGKWQGVWKRWDRYGYQDLQCNFNDGYGICKPVVHGTVSRLGSICYKDGKQVECCREEDLEVGYSWDNRKKTVNG
jgi:ketosteroid isomerase-like protein